MAHEEFFKKVDRLVTKEYMRSLAEQHKDGLTGIIRDTIRGNLRNGTMYIRVRKHKDCAPHGVLEPVGMGLDPGLVDPFLKRFEECSKSHVHDLVMCAAVPYLIGQDQLLTVLYEEAGEMQVKGDFLGRLDSLAEAADISSIIYEDMGDFLSKENILDMVAGNPRYGEVILEYQKTTSDQTRRQ